jgi:uncharacterized protein (TIGR03437 family)
VASGSLPAGLSLSGSGLLAGTPTTAGTATFAVRVTDSANASQTANVSITIGAQNESLSITSSSPQAGTAGSGYSFTFAAAGGTPPYSWSLLTGQLPSGLTLSGAGVLSGTPAAAGQFQFAVRVTDSAGANANANVALIINSSGLTISLAAPNTGAVGVSYSFTFTATGGSVPYSWSISAGAPPPGLTLSAAGTMSGTPTAAGTFNLTVRVTDSANATATRAVTVTINPGGTPTISSVENGASFVPAIAPNSWITIRGSNLAATTRENRADEIVNGRRPTSMDGVSVTVNNRPAFFYFISPNQLNVVSPDDDAIGPVQVKVLRNGVESNVFTGNLQRYAPAFFLWPENQAVATDAAFQYRVRNGTFPTLATVAAKPGEVLILWGTGFGPANPNVPAGQVVTGAPLVQGVAVTLNGRPLQVFATAMAPLFTSLYQIAVQIPADMPDGDWPIVATIGGVSSPATIVLAVRR